MSQEDVDSPRANVDLTKNSDTGGFVSVTIAATPADITPDSQPCLSCLVQQKSGTQAYMNIRAEASADTWKLSSTSPIPVPVRNLNQLHFFGTAADVIQILWRN